MYAYKILIVEDDKNLALGLVDFFERNDFEVTHVSTGEEAVEIYEKINPSVVLLDVNLPGINGFEVIENIRKIDNSTPILMMTGEKYDTDSRIKGFDMGAVNYVQKPVVPLVLLAQINNLLNPHIIQKYIINGYRITIQSTEIKINNSFYCLRDSDIRVFSALLQNQNIMVSRNELLLSAWKRNDVSLNSHLDALIYRLRKIISNHPGIKIENEYSEGYRLC